MFAVDAGSTMAVGKAMEKYGLHAKGVHAGGFDLLPQTLDAIARGRSRLHHRPAALPAGLLHRDGNGDVQDSGGLAGPAEINTGLKFVTKSNVEPYRSTQSRYEGQFVSREGRRALRPDHRLTGADAMRMNEPGRRLAGPQALMRTGAASAALAGRYRAALA